MEMTRKEFQDFVKENNLEVFTSKQVCAFCQDILKSTDPKERENGAIDFASLGSVTVRENDLSKSLMYFRPVSIVWEIDENSIMKSRTGYYRDTPANRRKGIVGKPYSDPKADQYEEAPRANTVARLKSDYAAAAKKGDKMAMAKIGEQIKKLAEKKESPVDKKEKKE
jgi:hypothetical protein